MAVAYVQEFPFVDRSTTNYDFVADKIGEGPFDGLIVHTAGFDEEAGVFRVLDVWDGGGGASFFLAFDAELLGGELRAQDDVVDARFFALDDLPELAFASTVEAIGRLRD